MPREIPDDSLGGFGEIVSSCESADNVKNLEGSGLAEKLAQPPTNKAQTPRAKAVLIELFIAPPYFPAYRKSAPWGFSRCSHLAAAACALRRILSACSFCTPKTSGTPGP